MNNSLWITEQKDNNYEELKENIDSDVCIIGGGLTGITTAYYLSKNNKKVILLEKNKIGEGTSGYTTGKITSQHDLFYKYLIDSLGEDLARQYLNANEKAIENIEKIVNEEKIECDFEKKDNYVFTMEEKEISKIKDEVKAVNKLGKNAEYISKESIHKELIKGGKEEEVKSILCAIKLKNQAQFNSYKYILGLSKIIEKSNSKIYENSKVIKIKKENDKYIVETEHGTVSSKYVVIASHYPIINFPGFYFMKMYQEMSYIIGIETNLKLFDGMYINSENPSISLRTAIDKDSKETVLLGGYGHKTGEKDNLVDPYKELEKIAKKLFPDYKVRYRWSTEDCISLDKIPYIGEFSSMTPNVYVATGYKKWGITTSNVAANIITDKILEKKNEYEDVFDSKRLKPIKNYKELTSMVKEVGNSLIVEKIKGANKYTEAIKTGEGKIVEIEGKKVGIYKDEKQKIYAIKPVCTHLGCELNWNNIDKTWDCPCHGSRFDYKGKNIYEPAMQNLTTIDIKE